MARALQSIAGSELGVGYYRINAAGHAAMIISLVAIDHIIRGDDAESPDFGLIEF